MVRVAKVVLLFLAIGSLPIEGQAQSWSHFTDKDEMTGKVTAYATSARTPPTDPMGFPYSDVTGWLGFGCDGQNEWAFLGFSKEPNLRDTETHDGYDSFRTRVRWDDNVTTVRMTKEWGDRFVNFTDDGMAIVNMGARQTALVELDWYGSGEVYFRISLNGSSDAIAAARRVCQG